MPSLALGDVTVKTLDLRTRGRRFDSSQVAVKWLGAYFTWMADQCLNCRGRGLWELNPQLFSQPPNTLSNYVLRGQQCYILYKHNLHHNFGRAPTIEKFS